jgi:hypothetical protein
MFSRLIESLISLSDWDKIVQIAKEKVEIAGSKKEAEELLAKQITFLDELDVKKAIDQAIEED